MTGAAGSAGVASLAGRIVAAPLVGRPDGRVRDGMGDVAGRHGRAFEDLLAGLAAYSPFLWRLALGDPERLERLASSEPDEVRRDIISRQRSVGASVRAGRMSREQAMRELRRNRAELALLVALADLGGLWGLDEVTAALTAFADASVGSAVAIALDEAQRAGRLLPRPDEASGRGCGLVVLALGKHGAGELNYSSDVDLVLFFDPDCPALTDPGRAAATYSRVGQSVAKLLSERTGDGYVHRVDYRLRPDPASTPVAVSLAAAYSYYESVGQNWERAAMIKARPIAGDMTLADTLLGDLKPFIWRKYFDFNAIADIHAMKRQIHAVRGHGTIAVAGHDIKLGRGGIREIEFFVQTQQLVFGGRRAALRGRRTLDMLAELEAEGWITGEARDELAAAYRFLRTIEHRLQMVADEQTQRLPPAGEALEAVARFCGFADLPAFSQVLTGHARRVQHHYGLLFEAGGELASDLGDLVFTGSDHDSATLATLGRLGFRDPGAAAETIRGWHFGRRPAITGARAREALTELIPPLIEAVAGTADPDGALSRLDLAFGRMPAAVELLTILRSKRALRLLFADLLGTAPRLAETVAASPHVLDALIDPGFVAPARDAAAIEADARAIIGPTDGATTAGTEEFLDRVRDGARQLQFVTGARLLSGVLSPPQAGAYYAAIARAAIRICLEWVRAVFESDHGRVPGGRVAVLGLGRLGSGNLTASSDLDLVVLYDFDGDHRSSDSGRALDAVVYYTRLTQRLVAALTAPTRRGKLFDIDLRLRPSGRKGPVAVQFAGFQAYHRGEAELWEEMALTRARVLAGDDAFGAVVDDAVAAIVGRRRREADVFPAVLAMRRLIEREKGTGEGWDLKLARGGLIDLDFLAQALILAHAHERPGLLRGTAPEALRAAVAAGLLEEGEAAILLESDAAFDAVTHWQRLTLGGQLSVAGSDTAMLHRLAAAAGAPSAAILRERLDDLRRSVREIFDRRLLSPRS